MKLNVSIESRTEMVTRTLSEPVTCQEIVLRMDFDAARKLRYVAGFAIPKAIDNAGSLTNEMRDFLKELFMKLDHETHSACGNSFK